MKRRLGILQQVTPIHFRRILGAQTKPATSPPLCNHMSSILYISYDGLMEPLGQSQVWQYLCGLSTNHQIVLLSYEKPVDFGNESEKARVKNSVCAKGVQWIPLRYHSKPSAIATAYDISLGAAICCYLVLRHRIKIVHARSYVASVVAFSLKKLLGIKFIFDMRGFWADERVDGGIWPKDSWLYRVAKWCEQIFLLNADVVVSLTHTAVIDMQSFPYLRGGQQKFVVIPTCANLQFFHPPLTPRVRNAKEFVLGYVGTVGTWYLFDEALRTFNALLKVKPNARLLIINRSEHAFIRERILALGVDTSKMELKSVPYNEVVQEIHRMDACVFYIKPVFSKRASAPTKFGELLACGVPCISNAGVGDTESILEGENVGVVLRTFEDDAHAQGLRELLKLVADPDLKFRCIKVANQYFALDQGIKAYDQIYRELC